MPRHLIGDAHEWINEIPHCPYSLSSETTAKPTVLGVLVCQCDFSSPLVSFSETRGWADFTVSQLYTFVGRRVGFRVYVKFAPFSGVNGLCLELVCWWPFFFLFVQQRGKKTLLSLTLICHCHLVGMAKIVRGSTFGYDHETPLLDDLADLL